MTRYDRMNALELAQHLEDWDKLPNGQAMFEAISDMCTASAKKLRSLASKNQAYIDMNDRRKAKEAVEAVAALRPRA